MKVPISQKVHSCRDSWACNLYRCAIKPPSAKEKCELYQVGHKFLIKMLSEPDLAMTGGGSPHTLMKLLFIRIPIICTLSLQTLECEHMELSWMKSFFNTLMNTAKKNNRKYLQ